MLKRLLLIIVILMVYTLIVMHNAKAEIIKSNLYIDKEFFNK